METRYRQRYYREKWRLATEALETIPDGVQGSLETRVLPRFLYIPSKILSDQMTSASEDGRRAIFERKGYKRPVFFAAVEL